MKLTAIESNVITLNVDWPTDNDAESYWHNPLHPVHETLIDNAELLFITLRRRFVGRRT